VAHIVGDGGKARAATERPRVGGGVQTWTYEPSGCVVTEAKSRWLTFDMRGRRRAQPFACPLDGKVRALVTEGHGRGGRKEW
jgi:hypothetical protein